MAAVLRHAAFAEESAEVEVLNASLEKMKSVTKKIQSSMARLDETGRSVQDAIAPIYGNTQRLQTQNLNIDRIMAAIEKVKQPLDMRNREERIIRSRPDRVGLAEYIASIDRTNQALRELKTTNMRSNQMAMSELSSLLAVGTGNLESIFKDALRQDSQPIEPLKQITQAQPFPTIPPAKSSQLRMIHSNMVRYTVHIAQVGALTPSAKVYASERGQYLALSLQNLATASLSTARKVQADAVYKPGSCAITTYATAIEGMYTAEYDSICLIFSREEWPSVLMATCQESLRTFTSTLQDLDAHIRNHVITDCYLAYEIVHVVSNASFKIESHTGGELKQALSDAAKPVRETAKSSLSSLLTDIKSKINSMLQIPQDGSGLPITGDVMTRLQLMTAYLIPLSSIMRSLSAGGWNRPGDFASSSSIPTLKSFDVGADGEQLFSQYATDSIEMLLSSLESKAKQLQKGRAVQGVFLANNIIVIERMIKESELHSLLGTARPKVEAWKKKAANYYLDTWKTDAMGFLLDVQYTSKQPRPPSVGQAIDSATVLKALSSKDKDAIKEKFKAFNQGFDEAVARHKQYKMDPDVRRLFGTEVQKIIEPLYARFWERYHDVDKGKGKYVKYDKAQLAAVLASLY